MQFLNEKAGLINPQAVEEAAEGLRVQVGLARGAEVAGVAVGAVASPEAVEALVVAEVAEVGNVRK